MGNYIPTTNGYLAAFRPGHPMSHRNGYVYVHRLVMARHLGRTLLRSELVHHVDEDKTNNRIKNLELTNDKWHRVKHRKSGSRLRMPDAPNPLIACECGCGKTFAMFDADGRPRRFISGHNSQSRAPVRARVLATLEQGPASTSELTRKAACSASSLTYLKQIGVITNLKYGIWAKKPI